MLPTGSGDPPRVDIDAVRAEALTCVRCGLAGGRTQVVWAAGNLDADLLFIGEAPGFHEDKQGDPFVGAAGQLLDTLLGEIGLDRTKAAIVNVIKCRPPGNRDPQPAEIEACTPWLEAQLAHMRPDVIVTLGNFATKFILEQPIGITRARGQKYPRRGAVVIPTFHPAAALRGGRFGGMSPIDALRQDFLLVRSVLDERAAARRAVERPREPVGAATAAATGGDSEQLGLF
ncbi:MAG TPA: uracil-DNA glycosylase [Actinomycetota bacterium]|jgi:DNA polymerase